MNAKVRKEQKTRHANNHPKYSNTIFDIVIYQTVSINSLINLIKAINFNQNNNKINYQKYKINLKSNTTKKHAP